MKRLPWLLLSLPLLLLTTPLLAKSNSSHYKAIQVKSFSNTGDSRLTASFLDSFNHGFRATLRKSKIADQILNDETNGVSPTLLLEGAFTNAASGNHLLSGSVSVIVNVFRPGESAPVKTIPVKVKFKGILYSDIEADIADFAGEQAAEFVAQDLKSFDLKHATPIAAPVATPATAVGSQPAAANPPVITPAAAPVAPAVGAAPALVATPAAVAPPAQEAEQAATLQFSSNPSGAELAIDGEYAGNAPSRIKVQPGKRVFTFTLSGYKPWTRTLTIQPGESRTIAAELEK